MSEDLNIKPHTLTAKVFDSIRVRTANEEKVIKFTQEKVVGHSENIFSENSMWNSEIVEYEHPDMGGRHPQKYYCYRFLIIEDNFVIPNLTE